ncbi:hypothetical protein AGMMS50268_39580 [Spirochaetia bacterium]|nr:hypothetical protein AGMMS50268_39580 [Spirochaetia bacterium]
MKKGLFFALFLGIAILSSCKGQSQVIFAPKEILVDGDGKGIGNFYIFQYELTVGEYKKYLELSGEQFDFDDWKFYDGPLNKRILGDTSPMANIDFIQTITFANWLSKHNKLKPVYEVTKDRAIIRDKNANGYRVPTSVEWEWAARGGVNSKGFVFPGSNDLDEVAWNDEGSVEVRLPPVGSKKPNELDLYDMFGSVKEWCWDPYITVKNKTGVVGEIGYQSGEEYLYDIPFDERLMDAVKPDNIQRLTRGLAYVTIRERFSYGEDFSVLPITGGEYVGIRLIRNAK